MHIIFIIGLVILVALDQITKWLAVAKLKSIHDIPIIEGIFHLTYVENRGAAFGMFQGKHLFFIVVTLVVVTFVSIYYFKLPMEKKYHWMRLAFILLISGAIGNLIDRVRLNYVIDFLYFKLIDFPVFNVADICVVIGVSILSIFILLTPDEKNIKGKI